MASTAKMATDAAEGVSFGNIKFVTLLSCIQGDIYYCESYKVDSETESRGLKSPAITRGA